MATGHIRAIREKLKEDVGVLRRRLENLAHQLQTRNNLLGFLGSAQWQPMAKNMQEEIESTKNRLCDLDFDNEEDVKMARVLTANVRVLRSMCSVNELKREISAMEHERELILGKLANAEKNVPGVRSA